MARFNKGELYIDGAGYAFGSEGIIDDEKAIAIGDVVQTTLLNNEGKHLDYITITINDKAHDIFGNAEITEDVAAAAGQAAMRLCADGMNRKLK